MSDGILHEFIFNMHNIVSHLRKASFALKRKQKLKKKIGNKNTIKASR